MNKYPEYTSLNLPEIGKKVLETWKQENTFQRSVEERSGAKPFVFFEGPPSANGLPGIHHAMARTIKDIFCRYKTQQGFQVNRKAGWDTHGLPIELGVEKELGITKEDIGKSISVDDYNEACRKAVMKYTDIWNEMTEKVGYWVDMDDPYVTYESKYMESVWHLLSQLYQKGLLYKGYTIQPYSPAAGTGLSSHELNQPGTYRDVKDTTVVAQFKVAEGSRNRLAELAGHNEGDFFFLAWTTTPWTLPSNTALAVGPKIEYVLVRSFNQYTHSPITVVVAKNLVGKVFSGKYEAVETVEELANYSSESKKVPYTVIASCHGKDLTGIQYEQLLPFVQPLEDADKAFHVIPGDFVTTEDGTGIVHIAPTFGADDAFVAKQAGIPGLLVLDEAGNQRPLVDLQGRFVKEVGEFGGKYVKNEYYSEDEQPEKSVDIEIAIKLKEENKAFKVEKYVHNYPHCWRTDKPVLYYPLDSWFIRTTDVKDRLIELNKTINWKPESTGTGRFGNWLENLNDWNLSRSRYWGIPIPIWRTEERDEEICIGSVEQLKNEIDKSIASGFMESNPLEKFTVGDMSKENYDLVDLHKHYVDQITLVSASGKPMQRESDLIDVWFDSGSMPYAQWHYPFENKEVFENNFPADFIAEGVDQTRGWFFTLHAIGTMCFDSVAYKNVVSNGLVLDKNGQKMSKRLGNAVDPFETIDQYGPDATRWYMVTNAPPWENLKFDIAGIQEVQRKFFRALHNTYAFFALYANIDNFRFEEEKIPLADRPEIDRWVISRLNSLVETVEDAYENYEPHRAGRVIQEFVVDHLSNWYVRLCRRRFWKGDYGQDKIAAYQTLYQCLETVARLAAPIAPFYTERLFGDLNGVTGQDSSFSVHLADFPKAVKEEIDADLEERMEIAQKVSSLVLALRKKENLRVRQPLQRIMIPSAGDHFKKQVEAVKSLILNEVNVKELEYLEEGSNLLVKKIKPNFKRLGKVYGKLMKHIAGAVARFEQADIANLEREGQIKLTVEDQELELVIEDFEITSQDIPGWLVASEGRLTVALDITLNQSLKEEGIARELVNRIQNIRKDRGLEVTDNIQIEVEAVEELQGVLQNFDQYIKAETLAQSIVPAAEVAGGESYELTEGLRTAISVKKCSISE